MKCENPQTNWNLKSIGMPSLPERMSAAEAHHHNAARRLDRLDRDIVEHRDKISKVEKEARLALAEIEKRINAAILWMALGAGGILLKVIAPKLGL